VTRRCTQRFGSFLERDQFRRFGLGTPNWRFFAVVDQAARLALETTDTELKTQLQQRLAALALKLQTMPAQGAGKTA
jgi:hypothetical protein